MVDRISPALAAYCPFSVGRDIMPSEGWGVRQEKAGGGEEGFALLLVLVGLAAVALIIAAVVQGARQYAHDTEAEVASVQMRAATDGALATVERDLAESGTSTAPVLRNESEMIMIGHVRVTISARPEASKLDLNAADILQIRALLLASGFAADRAARLADQIGDWRDADSETRPLGAETGDYLMAGRSYGAANKPFASVSEISMLLDGSADLVTCLAPDLTVFTRRRDVDLAHASDRLRHALAADDAKGTASTLSVIAGRAIAAGGIYELDARAKGGVGEGVEFSLRRVVRVTGDSRQPVWLLSQQSPIPTADDSARACVRAVRMSGAGS